MFGIKKAKVNNEISFDPEKQYAVIRSSICTGEKVQERFLKIADEIVELRKG